MYTISRAHYGFWLSEQFGDNFPTCIQCIGFILWALFGNIVPYFYPHPYVLPWSAWSRVIVKPERSANYPPFNVIYYIFMFINLF